MLIHGEVVHKSEKNTSQNSRHIYTFHCFDQKDTEYSRENWSVFIAIAGFHNHLISLKFNLNVSFKINYVLAEFFCC